MDNNKIKYVDPMMELIHFEVHDIVTASTPDKNEDDDGWTSV